MPNPIQHGTHNDRNIIVDAVYDKGGRMIAMRTPNGHLTEYDYDTLGRRTGLTNPLGQTWETAYADLPNGGTRTTATYPGLASGGSYDVQRDFDALGRLTQIHYGNAGITPTVSFGYDAAGNRASMIEHNGTANSRITEYDYDAARRLTAVASDANADGTPEQTVGYAYDIAGRRTQLTFDGVSVGYEYDERGRLVKVTDWNNGETTFGYDSAGRHTATNRPNGVSSAYAHDPAGRLTEILHQSGEDVLAQFGYTVDGRGNRTQAVEALRQPNGTINSRTVNYSYDALARLLTANDGTTSYGYSFDRAGNRLSQTVNGVTTNYSYNAANQLTSDGTHTHTYDSNGNLTSDGVTAYSWDRANRMLSAGDHSYAYDGNGVRIRQTVNGIVTDYLMDTQPGLAVVLKASGTQDHRYLHSPLGILGQEILGAVGSPAIWGQAVWGQATWGGGSTQGLQYLLQDGLGSVRSLVTGGGTVDSVATYRPFGEVESGGVNTLFKFTGEQTDDNELVYLRARYMNPAMGGFVSLDPFEGVSARPMSLNGYSWVEGNVVNRVDPYGLAPYSSTLTLPTNASRLASTLNSGACNSDNRVFIRYQSQTALPDWWLSVCAVFGDNDEAVGAYTGSAIWRDYNQALSSEYGDFISRYVDSSAGIRETINQRTLFGYQRTLSRTFANGLEVAGFIGDGLKALCEASEGDIVGFTWTVAEIAASYAFPPVGIALWVIDLGAHLGFWPDFIDDLTDIADDRLRDTISRELNETQRGLELLEQGLRYTDPTQSGNNTGLPDCPMNSIVEIEIFGIKFLFCGLQQVNRER